MHFCWLRCLCFCSSVTDKRTGVKYAIKKFNRPFQSSTHARRTFRELQLLSQLHHDNVMCKCIILLLVYTVQHEFLNFVILYIF